MGMFVTSLHFRADDSAAVVESARAVLTELGGRMLIAPARAGWVAAYPDEHAASTEAVSKIMVGAGVGRALLFDVHDSDILRYWYLRDGEIADYYNSCPDYFGEVEEGDMEAVGDAAEFEGLLDADGRGRLAEILRPRMIDGEEVGGETPVFEEERLWEIADLLGIQGVMGSFDVLLSGEEVEGAAGLGAMVLVGAGE